jgi:hypothetical protein
MGTRVGNCFRNGVAVGTPHHPKINRRRIAPDVKKRIRALGTNRRIETLPQPGGNRYGGRRLRLLGSVECHLAKDRVDESSHALPAFVADELNGIVHDRVHGHATQVQELEGARAKDRSNPIVDLDRARSVTLDGSVQVRDDAKCAVDDLSGKRRVDATRTDSPKLRIERGRRPCPIVRHSMENMHRDPSRLRNHERKLPRVATGGTEIGDALERMIP